MKELFEKYRNLMNVRDLERQLELSHGILYRWRDGRNKLDKDVSVKLKQYLTKFQEDIAKGVAHAV